MGWMGGTVASPFVTGKGMSHFPNGQSMAMLDMCDKTMPQLDVFREDIPCAQFQCYPCMHAHNYCILHRLNVCGIQCTSYYIGYLLSIKAGCVILLSNLSSTVVPQPATPHDGCPATI